MQLRDATTDADFDIWLNNFSALLTAAPTTYGLVAADATAVAAAKTTWNTAYALATDPTTRTSPALAAKDAAKAAALAVVRPYNVAIGNNSGVSDANKTAIGATVKKTVPTPVPPPITSPTLAQVTSIGGQITLAYRDQSTPTSKGKPAGVTGLQLNRAIGVTAATDPAQTSFYAVATKSPVAVGFDGSERGKHCTFAARWVTRSGPGGMAQFGPWSDLLDTIVQ